MFKHPAYNILRPVSPSVGVILCDNPSYSALEGTNTWVIRSGEDKKAIIIDPGPEDEGHLNIVNAQSGEVALILLTHRHGDHADGAQRLRQLTGAPIRAFEKAYTNGAEPLEAGEVISVDGVTPQIEVVHTPGHTRDSVCFFIWSGEPGKSELEGIATGDTIAGRHTTMLSESDGDLGEYLETLEMLEKRGAGVRLLPGHGPDLEDLSEFARKYIDRRHHRINQIKEVRGRLGDDVDLKTLIDEMYDDVDPVLRHAAEQSTRAALKYLDTH